MDVKAVSTSLVSTGSPLAQPGGFEGPIAVAVSLASHDNAVTHRPQVADANVELCAAGGATSRDANEGEDFVVCLPEPLGFRAEPMEHVSPVREEPNDVLTTPDRSLSTRLSGIHSASGWASSVKGFQVAGVHRRVKPPHDLHVLLRHRPPSISLRPQPGDFAGLEATGERR